MVSQTFLLISCVLTGFLAVAFWLWLPGCGFLAVAFAIVSRAHEDTNFYTKVPMIPLPHMPPLLPLTAVNTGYSAAGRAGLSAAARREFGPSPSAFLVLSCLPPYRARSPAGLLCDHPGQGGESCKGPAPPATVLAALWAPLWTHLPRREDGQSQGSHNVSGSHCS